MSEANGHQPPTIEGPGRYHVFAAPDGSWVIARAGNLCDRCQDCGCGEQAEPIVVPAMIIRLGMQQGFSLGKAKQALKAAVRRQE